MKKALIHDWLEKYGGAERVLTAISEIYDFDYYYTYINLMTPSQQQKAYSKNVAVSQSKLLRIANYNFRKLLPFFPYIVKSFNKQTKRNKVDLVISSSWALSKAYRIGNEIHICYLQARNFKYVWDEAHLYFNGRYKWFSFFKGPLQRFDLRMSKNPDYLIANSIFVKEWVKKRYNRDATVIYPPVDIEDFGISEDRKSYYIAVGRLEPYKRFDILIDAFNSNQKELIVVGSGSQLEKLKNKAKSNIKFKGFLDKDIIKVLLQESQAFVYAGVEDFGISLVEALASGVSVIAYDGGAANEIVKNGINGLLFPEQNSNSLNQAIELFEKNKDRFEPNSLRNSVVQFSKANFQQNFKQFVDEVLKNHNIK